MKDASLVIIANNHPEFQKFNVSENTYLMKHHSIVYDFWNTMDYNQTNFAEHVHYFCLGNFKLCLAMLEKNNQT